MSKIGDHEADQRLFMCKSFHLFLFEELVENSATPFVCSLNGFAVNRCSLVLHVQSLYFVSVSALSNPSPRL